MSDSITKAEFRILEKMFAKEIACALASSAMPPLYQSKAKIMSTLREKKLIDETTVNLGGRFPMTVTGWLLTEAGRFAYCSRC